ncbi:MAG: AAA family ATPase [bacterium]
MEGVEIVSRMRQEIKKVVIGQEHIIDSVIRAILANGHLLIEGVPGLAKTVLIRAFSQVMGCEFKRVQFTVDLLPSDVIGLNSFDAVTKSYKIVEGPVFANLLLADEINRASPKVQSALLEAMAEKQVTIGNETRHLPLPFFVFATQNPLENLGTYPLPQAQLDRFLFKLVIDYPTIHDETQILDMRMSDGRFEEIETLLQPKGIMDLQEEVSKVHISEDVKKYIVHIINATRYPQKYGLKNADYLEVGCGPRATIAIVNSSRAEAFMNQRDYVTPQDVKEIAYDVLRHRLEINYLGQAKGVTTEKIIQEILFSVAVP